MKEERILVSFVIPAHNAERTLENTVTSIISDTDTITNSRFEVLIVENGSTDQTINIAKSIVQEHENIHFFTSKTGVSAARNVGISHARGKYLFFLDSDDTISIGGIKFLILDAENYDADLIMYGYKVGEKSKNVSNLKLLPSLDAQKVEMISNPTKYMQAWSKLFLRDLILKSHVRFDERLKLSEDSDFTMSYLMHCNSIVFSKNAIYNYTLNSNSVMHNSSVEKVKEYSNAMSITKKKYLTAENNIQAAVDRYALIHFNIAMVREVFLINTDDNLGKRIKKMKAVIKDEAFKKSLDKINIRDCITPSMFPILMIKLHLFLGAGFLYRFKSWINYRNEKNYGK